MSVTSESPIRVLLADDEPHLGAILEQFLVARGFAVTAVRNGRLALEALQQAPYDVALLDVVMPEMDGLEVLRRLREETTPPEILIITGNGTVETSLAALRLGAYDVLSKPYRMAEIEALIRRAFEKRLLVRENLRLRARMAAHGPPASEAFLTQYAPLRAMLTALDAVRDGDAPAIVWGEAGTGKRAFARWLHRRADAPFIECNLATVPPADVLRTVLGAESATDGVEIGVLEMAAGGTLLLRAIARLPHEVQRALAEVVTRGWFTRVGGTQPIPVECRVVNALLRDPDVLIQEGALDAAVAHALSVIRVALPALRERAVDIPLLAEHFAARLQPSRRVAADAIAVLEQRAWPQNVRELEATLRDAAARAGTGAITAAELATGAAHDASPDRPATASGAPLPPAGLRLDALERAYIESTLQAVGWHQGRAADALGISPKTLYRKIREYGFTRPSGRSMR